MRSPHGAPSERLRLRQRPVATSATYPSPPDAFLAPVMPRDAILDAKEKASISFTALCEQVTVGLTVVRSVTP